MDQTGEVKVKTLTSYPTATEHNEMVPGLTSIIIPCFFNTYSVFHYTGNCIGSIREHTDKIKTPYEIIMVINGDTNIGWLDTEARLWNGLPVSEAHVDKIIPNKENLGYAKAVNQGICVAKGEYIALLNNDTMVFDHWLEDLQEALETVDMVQAMPMYGKPWARATEANFLRENALGSSLTESLSDFRDFSGVLTKKELFNKVGLFDENFKMYCEDVDMVRRIQEAGGIVKSSKRVNITHIIGATSITEKNMGEIMDASKAYFKEKWKE